MTDPELRRRIEYLMLFRVGLITIVLSLTVVLNLASPRELAAPGAISLFVIVGATYLLTLIYAVTLGRVANPSRFAAAQLMGDLFITTALVHVSGGAQSGYTFLYPLSIIGAAIVRYRRGAVVVALLSVVLFTAVALLGFERILPMPSGARTLPWDLTRWELARQMMLNVGAMTAVGFLAAQLGGQLSRAGQSLARQQERTLDLAALKDDIIRCLSSGLVTVDREGMVLTANEAAGEILGIAPDAAVGRPIGDLVPAVAPLLTRLGEREAARRGEVTARRAGGDELVLGVSVSPLVDGRNEPIGRILNFQDLTELRRMESQVKRAERLAAVGGLAAGIAHEIRNPLASISGSIELLRAAPGLDGDNRELMEIVLREVDRLNGLVTDLLAYARPRERVPAPVDLAALLGETVGVFAQDRTGKATARLEPCQPLTIQADAAQIRQVVWNLLRNAAESMPEGGEVVVSLTARGAWAEICVADAGAGIAPEDQEKVFEPFFTTKARGSGLGLAIVHRIVTEHGGNIQIDSARGQGARITVRLPRG